jgi:hypothetical protein
MIKKVSFFIGIAILSFLLGWWAMKENASTNRPIRPENVPEEAFWAGGADGGNWYLINKVDTIQNRAIITVYNDQSGDRILTKWFLINCPSDHAVSITNLRELINAFDGERIYLKAKNGKKECLMQ